MELNNRIKPFPKYLSNELKSIIGLHKTVRTDGIIYKRDLRTEYEKFIDRSKFTQRDYNPY